MGNRSVKFLMDGKEYDAYIYLLKDNVYRITSNKGKELYIGEVVTIDDKMMPHGIGLYAISTFTLKVGKYFESECTDQYYTFTKKSYFKVLKYHHDGDFKHYIYSELEVQDLEYRYDCNNLHYRNYCVYKHIFENEPSKNYFLETEKKCTAYWNDYKFIGEFTNHSCFADWMGPKKFKIKFHGHIMLGDQKIFDTNDYEVKAIEGEDPELYIAAHEKGITLSLNGRIIKEEVFRYINEDI